MDQKFFEEKRHRRESIAPDWRECKQVLLVTFTPIRREFYTIIF